MFYQPVRYVARNLDGEMLEREAFNAKTSRGK